MARGDPPPGSAASALPVVGRPRRWIANARIERFVEPALLLLLRDGESHGYDLADGLAELAPDDRVDLGNLYRLLRDLEAEGLVAVPVARTTSRAGPSAPTTLTKEGHAVLDAWAESLTREPAHDRPLPPKRYAADQIDRRGDALGVEGAVAPRPRQRPRPLEEAGAGRARPCTRWRRGTAATPGP